MKLRVLIADESEAVRKIAAEILGQMGYDCTGCATTLDVLARSDAQMPDALIVDSAMTGALDLIRAIRTMHDGHRPLILYSLVKADLRCLMAGKTAGASDFLLKPFDRKVLAAAFAAVPTMEAVA
jgi:two-component system chemotaxis response regulator CheY